MEIYLELENSDLIIEFESSFFDQNFSDQTEVCWNLHHGNYTPIMGDVFPSTYASESICQCLQTQLRLCSGYNEAKLR